MASSNKRRQLDAQMVNLLCYLRNSDMPASKLAGIYGKATWCEKTQALLSAFDNAETVKEADHFLAELLVGCQDE